MKRKPTKKQAKDRARFIVEIPADLDVLLKKRAAGQRRSRHAQVVYLIERECRPEAA